MSDQPKSLISKRLRSVVSLGFVAAVMGCGARYDQIVLSLLACYWPVSHLGWRYDLRGIIPTLLAAGIGLSVARLLGDENSPGPSLLTQLSAVLLLAFIGCSGAIAHFEQTLITRTDPLTGLLNGTGFELQLKKMSEKALRDEMPLAIAYLDCDNFKQFNETRGHRAGDQFRVCISKVGTHLVGNGFQSSVFSTIQSRFPPSGIEDEQMPACSSLTTAN